MRTGYVLVALLAAMYSWGNPSLFMPRNSYLVRPVSSARELAQQIRTEPVVAQRYARHFKQPAYAIADFFEKNLRLTRLERSDEFFVYYAPPDGQLLVKRRLLPRGKEVFVLKSTGKPVLLAECGNPMTPMVSLPQPTVEAPAAPVVSAKSTPLIIEPAPDSVMPTVELVEIPLEEAVAADLFPPAALSELETLPETVPESPSPLAPPAEMPEIPMSPIRRNNWWGLISLIPLLFINQGGSPEVIPEPSTWLALTVGWSMLYTLSGRARRRWRNSSQRAESSR